MIHAYQDAGGQQILTNATVVTPTDVIERGTVVIAGAIAQLGQIGARRCVVSGIARG